MGCGRVLGLRDVCVTQDAACVVSTRGETTLTLTRRGHTRRIQGVKSFCAEHMSVAGSKRDARSDLYRDVTSGPKQTGASRSNSAPAVSVDDGSGDDARELLPLDAGRGNWRAEQHHVLDDAFCVCANKPEVKTAPALSRTKASVDSRPFATRNFKLSAPASDSETNISPSVWCLWEMTNFHMFFSLYLSQFFQVASLKKEKPVQIRAVLWKDNRACFTLICVVH